MNSLSKIKAKYIKSLQHKKSRIQEGKFIVEGSKSVREFLQSDYVVEEVVATNDFYHEIDHNLLPDSVYLTNADELAALGTFKTNKAALAIVHTKLQTILKKSTKEVMLALDNINDPGNLGTIIRIADWYGIDKLILNDNSVEVYNPKVVSASKGSLTRVNIYNLNLAVFLADYQGDVFAADLVGEPLNLIEPINSGVLLMGSESHGISDALTPYITKKITIPGRGGAESLNVAVATGIICNHLLA